MRSLGGHHFLTIWPGDLESSLFPPGRQVAGLNSGINASSKPADGYLIIAVAGIPKSSSVALK